MNIPIYHVDAFTSQVFAGNPAAVCPLNQWLDASTLQAIARENNVSETAFIIPRDDHYEIRWFSPAVEIDLCGHATLAAAFVLFSHMGASSDQVRFISPRSGELAVQRHNDLLVLDFPARKPSACVPPAELLAGLGRQPLEVLSAEDYLAVFDTEDAVTALQPDMAILKTLGLRGVIVTAKGKSVDFVSRFFAPKLGIDEDPVTGSAHCTLVPYWKNELAKTAFQARQVSARGGELFCEDRGDRVAIAGKAVMFMQGTITL